MGAAEKFACLVALAVFAGGAAGLFSSACCRTNSRPGARAT